MANPSDFNRRMRGLGAKIERNAEKLVRKACLAIHGTVVLATPVDTGRARANWQVGVGSQPTGELADTDKSGGATIAKGKAEIANYKEGKDVYIANNLAYIGRLNDGYSAQAPAGFVEQAIDVGLNAVAGVSLLGNGE